MSFNRREFIKSGSLLMGGLLIAGNGSATPANERKSYEWALEHFKVTPQQLQKVIRVAMENGADYADLFFEHSLSNSIRLTDNQVNSASSDIDFGVGVRVVIGDQTGYAYTENVTLDELTKAAKTAAQIAAGNKRKINLDVTELKVPKNYYGVGTSWQEIIVSDKKPFLEKLNNRIFALDSRVEKVTVMHADTTSHILFYNSEGTLYYDYRPMTMLIASCVMQQNGRRENNSASRSYRMGFEFLNDELIETMAKEAVQRTAILFDAVKPKGGEMPVVMGAGGSGILLHEAIGHAFEADFNRKNTSIFSDKLGKKVCHESIQVVDDGTIPFNRGAVNVDDEGVIGQKTYIVKDGILNSYLHDRISAKHYGVAPTGNGRRQSFRCAPIPRMRATYMENGKSSEADMISQVKNGVFVDVFSNGQVQIGAGDFTFYVKSGYLIENGKLSTPIKDINIIGNGPKALADITMVANNYKMDNGTWTCGKDGQSCPVTCGMPAVLVSKLTVGGDN